jgi:methylated-DNA-[protein]-cysteine S-methyltransferase
MTARDKDAARRAMAQPATGQSGAWARVETRLGTFLVASLDGAIVQTGLPSADLAGFGRSLAERHPGAAFREDPNDPLLRRAAAQLREYAEGARHSFDLPVRLEGTEFQRRVWNALAAIPFGQVRSYQEVARAIGRPGASRAVGQANHMNPVAPIIPCHRVVTSGGTLGGYGGGMPLKRALLEHEGVELDT